MSVLGEAALSGFFQVLFSKLTSPELLEFLNQDQVQADLMKWKIMLLKIRAVLDDAEEKQMTSRGVKIWFDELRDLAFDAEDVLDKFATEALQHKLNGEFDWFFLFSQMDRSFLLDFFSCQSSSNNNNEN